MEIHLHVNYFTTKLYNSKVKVAKNVYIVMNLKFLTSSAKYIIAYSNILPVIYTVYTLQNKNHILHPS